MQVDNQLDLQNIDSVSDLCSKVLPNDDSSLQWSENQSGRCLDLDAELNRLYERLVSYADEEHGRQRRTDDDLWRTFNRSLEQRNLLGLEQVKTFKTTDDEVHFDHAFKNGVWHCIKPLSFDLVNASNIRDKAHKWLGQMNSVNTEVESASLYFLLAKPDSPELHKAYENAISILGKIPTKTSFYREDQTGELADKIQNIMHQ